MRGKDMKIRKGTIIRTIFLFIALIIQCLTVAGKIILPFCSEQMTDFLTMVFTAISSIIAWWENNSFTQEALSADIELRRLKEEEDEIIESEEPEVNMSPSGGQNPNKIMGIE